MYVCIYALLTVELRAANSLIVSLNKMRHNPTANGCYTSHYVKLFLKVGCFFLALRADS